MNLPQEFLEKMQVLMEKDEYEDFLSSFHKPRYYGLRVNTLKISVEEFLEISPMDLEPIPWTKDGFYYKEGQNPGKHPYYGAGLYYIQEPSAMLPGAIIAPKPGEYVLDLCAAPGGKTVQMAAAMKGEGLLVANDINSDRVKALVKNIELCGITNAIVTNDTPLNLSLRFESYFDRILVDAPCSGEGMFRKDEDARKSWGRYKCDMCSKMQMEILDNVDKMLKPGGYMVYSTCTFSPEENEKMICYFMEKFDHYEIVDIPKVAGIEDGRPQWCDNNSEIKKTARLWPNKVKGEGHFVALLRKLPFDEKLNKSVKDKKGNKCGENYLINKGKEKEEEFYKESCINPQTKRKSDKNAKLKDKKYSQEKSSHGFKDMQAILSDGREFESYYKFLKENLTVDIEGYYITKGNNLYWLPVCPPDLSGIKVAKFGRYIGEISNKGFEPSHSFVISLSKDSLKNTVDFSGSSEDVIRYLKGETLMLEGNKGYVAITVDGYTLGWGKQMGYMIKNLYPKGWRKLV